MTEFFSAAPTKAKIDFLDAFIYIFYFIYIYIYIHIYIYIIFFIYFFLPKRQDLGLLTAISNEDWRRDICIL